MVEDEEEYSRINKEFYKMLRKSITGIGPKKFLNFQSVQQNGIESWRKLSNYYDPRMGNDRTVAFTRVLRPGGHIPRAKEINTALETLLEWESEVEHFERKYGTLLTDAEKLSAIRELMPAEIYVVGVPARDNSEGWFDTPDASWPRRPGHVRGVPSSLPVSSPTHSTSGRRAFLRFP